MNVHVESPPTAVAGDSCTAAIIVENSSDVVRSFRLTVTGVEGWGQVVPDTLSLFPGETGQARLVFRPPASPAVIAGPHPFAVRCAATDTDESRVEEGIVTVAKYTALDLDLRPNCARARRRATFRLRVSNVGNHAGRFQLSVDDENDMLRFDLTAPTVRLAPGETTIVRLKAAQIAARPGENLPFRVTVDPADLTPATTTGSVSVRPSLLMKVLPLIAAIVAIALVALAIWPKDPVSQAADAPIRTTIPASSTSPTSTVPEATSTTTSTTVAATTTTLPPTQVDTTTTVAAPTSTVAQQQSEGPLPPQPESPSTAPTTTAAPPPITMVITTIFFPPVISVYVPPTPPPPKTEYASVDVSVYFHVDPHWLLDFTQNCQFIHSPTEVDAFTTAVPAGWSIDTTKGDYGHVGLADIADNSNNQARGTLQQYDFQVSGANWFVKGIVCGASNDGPGAIFAHTYRVFLTRTV